MSLKMYHPLSFRSNTYNNLPPFISTDFDNKLLYVSGTFCCEILSARGLDNDLANRKLLYVKYSVLPGIEGETKPCTEEELNWRQFFSLSVNWSIRQVKSDLIKFELCQRLSHNQKKVLGSMTLPLSPSLTYCLGQSLFNIPLLGECTSSLSVKFLYQPNESPTGFYPSGFQQPILKKSNGLLHVNIGKCRMVKSPYQSLQEYFLSFSVNDKMYSSRVETLKDYSIPFSEQLILPIDFKSDPTTDPIILLNLFHNSYSESLGTLFLPISSDITLNGKVVNQWFPISNCNNSGSKVCDIYISLQFIPDSLSYNPPTCDNINDCYMKSDIISSKTLSFQITQHKLQFQPKYGDVSPVIGISFDDKIINEKHTLPLMDLSDQFNDIITLDLPKYKSEYSLYFTLYNDNDQNQNNLLYLQKIDILDLKDIDDIPMDVYFGDPDSNNPSNEDYGSITCLFKLIVADKLNETKQEKEKNIDEENNRIVVELNQFNFTQTHEPYNIFYKLRLNNKEKFLRSKNYPSICQMLTTNDSYSFNGNEESKFELYIYNYNNSTSNLLGKFIVEIEEALNLSIQNKWINIDSCDVPIKLRFNIYQLRKLSDINALRSESQSKFYNNLFKYKLTFIMLDKKNENLVPYKDLIAKLSSYDDFKECFTFIGYRYSESIVNSMFLKETLPKLPRLLRWNDFNRFLNELYYNIFLSLQYSRICQLCDYYPTSKDCNLCQYLYCVQCCKQDHLNPVHINNPELILNNKTNAYSTYDYTTDNHSDTTNYTDNTKNTNMLFTKSNKVNEYGNSNKINNNMNTGGKLTRYPIPMNPKQVQTANYGNNNLYQSNSRENLNNQTNCTNKYKNTTDSIFGDEYHNKKEKTNPRDSKQLQEELKRYKMLYKTVNQDYQRLIDATVNIRMNPINEFRVENASRVALEERIKQLTIYSMGLQAQIKSIQSKPRNAYPNNDKDKVILDLEDQAQILRTNLINMQSQIQRLNLVNESLSLQLREQNSKKSKIDKKKEDKLKDDQLTQETKEKNELIEQSNELKKEIETLKVDNDKSNNDLKKEIEKLKTENENLKSEIKKEIETSNIDNNKLNNELDRLRSELTDSNREKEQLKIEKDRLIESTTNLDKLIAQKDQETSQLKNQLSSGPDNRTVHINADKSSHTSDYNPKNDSKNYSKNNSECESNSVLKLDPNPTRDPQKSLDSSFSLSPIDHSTPIPSSRDDPLICTATIVKIEFTVYLPDVCGLPVPLLCNLEPLRLLAVIDFAEPSPVILQKLVCDLSPLKQSYFFETYNVITETFNDYKCTAQYYKFSPTITHFIETPIYESTPLICNLCPIQNQTSVDVCQPNSAVQTITEQPTYNCTLKPIVFDLQLFIYKEDNITQYDDLPELTCPLTLVSIPHTFSSYQRPIAVEIQEVTTPLYCTLEPTQIPQFFQTPVFYESAPKNTNRIVPLICTLPLFSNHSVVTKFEDDQSSKDTFIQTSLVCTLTVYKFTHTFNHFTNNTDIRPIIRKDFQSHDSSFYDRNQHIISEGSSREVLPNDLYDQSSNMYSNINLPNTTADSQNTENIHNNNISGSNTINTNNHPLEQELMFDDNNSSPSSKISFTNSSSILPPSDNNRRLVNGNRTTNNLESHHTLDQISQNGNPNETEYNDSDNTPNENDRYLPPKSDDEFDLDLSV